MQFIALLAHHRLLARYTSHGDMDHSSSGYSNYSSRTSCVIDQLQRGYRQRLNQFPSHQCRENILRCCDQGSDTGVSRPQIVLSPSSDNGSEKQTMRL
ncbi:Trans-acting enoyl reductase [Fusarium oxysporum f. sp. albedinis]|nr:Trans-acting enoyl reductase [Fusarium oxysporum f. sp. albedinis]